MEDDTMNEIREFNIEVDKIYKQVENEFEEYKNDANNKELLKCLKNTNI